MGDGNLRGFGSLAVGGGSGFRLKVAPDRRTGLVRSDTVRGGPFLGGAGGGVIYHINPHIAWPTELRALAGFPDDRRLGRTDDRPGVRVAFWTAAGGRLG